MKNLLILTTLSLITMQGFTVWGHEETTKESYEINQNTFRMCFDDAKCGRSRLYSDKDKHSSQSCHQHLKNIVDKMGNGGTILTDKDGKNSQFNRKS